MYVIYPIQYGVKIADKVYNIIQNWTCSDPRSLVNTVASSILYILFASVLSYFSCAIIYFFSPTMLTWNLQHEYLTTRVVLFISKAFSSNHRSLLWIDLISPPFPPKISSVTHNCRTLTANCAYCQYCTSQEFETWYIVSPLEHRTESLLTKSQCVVCINVKVGVGLR